MQTILGELLAPLLAHQQPLGGRLAFECLLFITHVTYEAARIGEVVDPKVLVRRGGAYSRWLTQREGRGQCRKNAVRSDPDATSFLTPEFG